MSTPSTASEQPSPSLAQSVEAAWKRVRWPVGNLTSRILERLAARLGLPLAGLLLILQILTGKPVRRVGGGRANSCTRYRSRKMNNVTQAESRNPELWFLLDCEHNPDVLSFHCQPARLWVWIRDRKGRRRRVSYIPDFLVITRDRIEFVQCKTTAELERDQQHPHPRYVRDEDGGWHYRAADDAAGELGISHRVYASEEGNPIAVRNLQYLSDYVGSESPDRASVAAATAMVRRARSVRVKEVLAAPGVEPASLWWLVANRHLWVDLERHLVFDPDTCWVHADEAALLTHTHLQLPDPAPSEPVISVCFRPGSGLLWDGVPWTVMNRGSKKLVLQRSDDPGEIVELNIKNAKKLVDAGSLGMDGMAEAQARASEERERITRLASEEENKRAVRRWRALEHHAHHGKLPPGVKLAAVRRWRKWHREGERRYGSGFIGLLRIRGRRPGCPDMDARQRELLTEAARGYVAGRRKVVQADAELRTGTGTVAAVYNRLAARCDEENVTPCPSLRSLQREIKREREADVLRSRCGSGPGYQLDGPLPMGSGQTPPHGDRVFQYGLIDHVQIKGRFVSSRTGKVLGSPWLTVLKDGYSRMPLGDNISYNAPAKDRVLATLMDCVRRWGRVPDCLCADQGSDFISNDVEDAIAVLGMHKMERPARKPRYGAIIERAFRSLDTRLVAEVPGSTKLLEFGRSLSSSRHPDREASWTLCELNGFIEEWLFEKYPRLIHTGIGQPPKERFEHSLALAGERAGRLVRYDRALEIQLSVTPRKRTRTVDPGNGITVLYLRYWNDAFAAGDVSGTSVPVKINPADPSLVFARVKGQWVDCHLAEGREYLLGRTWRQIRLAVEEMKEQIRSGALERRLDAVTIGQFLRKVDLASDTALARQIARDAEVPPSPRPGAQAGPGGPVHVPGSHGAPPPGSHPSPEGEDDPRDDDDTDFSLDDLEPFDEC